jgi:hypothetical protein
MNKATENRRKESHALKKAKEAESEEERRKWTTHANDYGDMASMRLRLALGHR